MEEALREADRLKAEKAARELEAHAWTISDREREIIAQLSAGQA